MSTASTPRVSVIVPSYNSGRTIGRTLESLRRQDTRHPFEVIVVDSSDDGTDQAIAAQFPEVRSIHLSEQTYQGRARNIGARMARSGILAFLDADCQADPGWVDALVAGLERNGAAGVGGPLRNANPGSAVSRAMFVLQFRATISLDGWQPVPNPPAANVAYRRSDFEAVGGFPEDMGSSEETVMHVRMAETGRTVFFQPAMAAAHWNLERLTAFLTHQVKQGRFYRLARFQAPLPGSPWLSCLWVTPLFPWVRFWRCRAVLLNEVPRWPSRLATFPPLLLGFIFYSLGEIRGHCEAVRWRRNHAEPS